MNPGSKIPRGASIDLVVGKGLSEETIPVPILIGLSVSAARDTLTMNLLSVGSVVGDESLSGDAANSAARVWQQNPAPGAQLRLGGTVDLWISNPEPTATE